MAKSEQMNDVTLLNELDQLSKDATGNNSTFIKENEALLDRYLGNPYGNEEPERSKVISQDVMDVVEADMVSLARVFLGPGDVLKFKPINEKNEEDRNEAASKTEYVDWQIRQQPWSFSVLSGYIKNALIQKTSVIKYFIEETTEVEEHKKTGLSNDELAVFQAGLEGEDVDSVKVDREEENEDDEENTVVLKVTKKRKVLKIIDVPLENFRMTRNATSKDDAALVGDVSVTTRGELLSKGFDREIISSLIMVGKAQIAENSRLKEIRDKQEGGPDSAVVNTNWASEEVEIQDLYPMLDFDGDGISERRHILRSGDVILLNEVFNHVPYSPMSSILMPHKAIGRSRAEITAPTAEAKTSILRGIQDNMYAVNSPRIGANMNIVMDDLLVMRPQGVVRSTSDTPITNDLMPIQIPFIGQEALMVIQYWDQARAQTTGSLLASQGLDADELSKETATRFQGVDKASKGKVELVARVMAETGFRQLFEGVAWLDSQFQDAKTEKKVLGGELKVDPSDWKYTHNVVSKVGLGAGDDEKILQTLTALWQLHQQLQASNSPMTDEVKRYNVLKNMVTASGLPEIADYFNNPEQPKELTLAQNEILTRMVEQLEQQLQQVQNPLAEAEQIKAQATLIKAQSDAETKITQMKVDQDQFMKTLISEFQQFQSTTALKLTELEVAANRDLNKEVEQNKGVVT